MPEVKLAMYRAMLASILDPLFLMDSYGKILATSDSVEKTFGWPSKILVGKNIKIIISGPFHSQHDTYLENYRKTGKTFLVGRPREFNAIRQDGTIFPCEVCISLMDYPDQPEIFFSGIVRDLTHQKHAEEERRKLDEKIQQTQKLESLGVLAGGIAHDFNNLLMGVLGNARIALEELSDSSPIRESLKQIETAAMRSADLAKQMLAYSGRGKFVVMIIDISVLVEETVHLLEVSISKNVVIKYNLARKLPAIDVDVTQIRQVFMNLITNASDAIGEKSGVITITTGAMSADEAYLSQTFLDENLTEGTYVFLEVSDTGCGMDEITQRKIFDPFFTTKPTGRGLGMAAVLGIVRGHRGAIKCYSEPGRGTSFKVLLPAVDLPIEELENDSVGLTKWQGTGTILIVDDEQTVRAVAKRILQRAGCKVITANDGLEGLEVYRQHSDEIDVVLLDMTMPRMGGEELFRELRRIRPDVRVVLSSGYNAEEAFSRFAGKKLEGFVQKPYGPAELIPIIHKALQNSRSEPNRPVGEGEDSTPTLAREGNESILVVDDDDIVRESLRVLFEMNGYSVLVAKNGNEAVNLYRNHLKSISLVILDRRMIGMSGEETLSQLLEIDSEIKVIFLSGSDTNVITSGDELQKAKAILPKPYTHEDFWYVIRHVLDGDTVK